MLSYVAFNFWGIVSFFKSGGKLFPIVTGNIDLCPEDPIFTGGVTLHKVSLFFLSTTVGQPY